MPQCLCKRHAAELRRQLRQPVDSTAQICAMVASIKLGADSATRLVCHSTVGACAG